MKSDGNRGNLPLLVFAMSASSTSVELLKVLSAAELSLSESSDAVLGNLQELTTALDRILRSASSASVPFSEFREYIRRVISSVSSDETIIVTAATLYLQLLSKVSLAYEELMLSTCMHHISRILKVAVGFKCAKGCDAKSTVCVEANHIPLIRFKIFLKELVGLTGSNLNEFHTHGFISIAIQSFGDYIRYARGSWFQEPLLKGVDAVLNDCDMDVHAIIYKAMLPIARMSLPRQNWTTLTEIIIRTAAGEIMPSRTPIGNRSCSSELVSAVEQDAVATNQERAQTNSPSEESSHRLPVVRFLEMCCIHVPDRADQRASLSSLIIRVLESLRECDVRDFSSFVLKASHHPKARVRLCAVELAAVFMAISSESSNDAVPVRTLMMKMLSDRANDRVPSIRVKAIMSLTEALKGLRADCDLAILNELVEIACLLIERMHDRKSRVRKSAVDFVGLSCQQLLERKVKNLSGKGSVQNLDHKGQESQFLSDDTLVKLVNHLKHRGTDAVSNVRLAASVQITRVILNLSECMEPLLRRNLVGFWCDVVLPHANDVDSRCRELCLKSVCSVLFPWQLDKKFDEVDWQASSYSSQFLADLFLAEIGSGRHAIPELGKRAVRAMSKNGSFGHLQLKFLSGKASYPPDSEELIPMRRGAWIVLAEVSSFVSVDLVKRALKEETITREVLSLRNRSACTIAANLVDTMTVQSRKELAVSLETALFTDCVTKEDKTDFIVSVVELLSFLDENAGSHLIERCVKLLLLITAEIEIEDQRCEKLLCMIGSICVFFNLTTEPPQSILNFVRALASNSTNSSKVRALALTTLGKICLCHGRRKKRGGTSNTQERKDECDTKAFNKIGEALTRRHISIFVHELENATSSATKNNAVMVLCDLCRLYTAVAEPYISRLAELLSDSSDFVRVQVLSSILSLLQEDYIKLRSGPILFQVARCLLDPSESVRETAEYGLLRVVAPKNSSILATSFIELIFVLNECKDCPIYNQSSLSQCAKSFDSQLQTGFEYRKMVYEVFLQGMTFEHRLRLPGRFRSEILSPILDQKLSLNSTSVRAVLTDTLSLFSHLQVRSGLDKNGPEDDGNSHVDVSDTSSSQQNNSDDRIHLPRGLDLVNKIQFLELRETTIPALLEIRHHLEELRSPVLKVLMGCLCTLLRPHRRDLETLIGDPVVRSEIQHELSAMVHNKRPERQSRGKEHEGNQKTPEEYQRCPTDVTKPASSPGTPAKLLSVPRTRPIRKQRKISLALSDSEDDGLMLAYVEDDRSRQLSRTIEGSPKLAAIATRSNPRSSKSPFTINVEDTPSGFALALARIEDAAKA